MDTAKWPQNFPEAGLVKQPMEEVNSSTCNTSSNRPILERKTKPQEQLNCPRCNSTNTKFCYYNNYSLTQPRYFCKTCRRYWTEGGSLRNVPVGGGSRKNKIRSLSSSSSTSSAPSNNRLPDLNPNKIHYKGQQDLNLGFHYMHNEKTHDMSQYIEASVSKSETNNITSNMSPVSALDLLRTGIASRGLDSFVPTPPIPDSNTLFSSGLLFNPFQDMKPAGTTLSFSIDHGIGNHGVHHDNNGTENGRLLFPFGDQLKQLSSTTPSEVDQNKGQGTSRGYWNGMLGGGSW